MKRFYLLILLPLHLLLANDDATQEEKKINVTMGAGLYAQSQPYTDADPLITPTPVVFFDNALLYMRWVRMGVYFAGEKREDYSWGLSLTLQPRPFGYQASDSSALRGMRDRDNSWEGGLALSFKADTLFCEMILMHDLLGKSNGMIVRAEAGMEYGYKDWSFYPSLMAIWHSREFNDYYYGVRSYESTLYRPSYSAHSDIDYSAQTYVDYAFNKRWHTLLNLRIDYLGSEIRKSPIVDDSLMVSGMASLIYNFSY